MTENCIIQGDCVEVLRKIPDNIVDLVVTSPPYNACKSYEAKLSESGYYEFINPVAKELTRILKDDGRFAINVVWNINRIEEYGNPSANIMLFPFLSWVRAIKGNGLQLRENIIWDQMNSGCKTAWGSWKSPSAPHIRHLTEYILVGCKKYWKKTGKGESDLTSDEFTRWTLDKWRIPPETKREHPAPFPEELAKRCIKLFSYVGDLVLDPFVGSGTTCVVAKKLGRRYIGIDIEPEFCRLAQRRLDNVPAKLESFMSLQEALP